MRIPTSLHRQRGRVIGWLLLILVIAACYWALRLFAPQILPGFLREPRTERGSAQASQTAQPAAADTRLAASPPLYKWKDERDQWHVTDTPPRGRSYETVRVNPGTNVVPAFVPPVLEADSPEDIDEVD